MEVGEGGTGSTTRGNGVRDCGEVGRGMKERRRNRRGKIVRMDNLKPE